MASKFTVGGGGLKAATGGKKHQEKDPREALGSTNTLLNNVFEHDGPPAPVIVMDNGSHMLRAGHPGEAAPRVALPSIVGQPPNHGVAMASGVKEYEVGEAAKVQRGMLRCTHPVEAGMVADWDAMEKLWAHVIFRELRVAPENYTFVLTQAPDTPNKQKETTLELVMETFNANSLYLGVAPVLALYSYGKTTGVAVDIGLQRTSAVPVHEGYCLTRQVATSRVAGEAVTHYLTKLLRDMGYGFSTVREQELINDVKEDLCYVMEPDFYRGLPPGGHIPQRTAAQLDPNNPESGFYATSSRGAESFQLPDGKRISLDDERHQCPEALFNHSVLGSEFIPKQKVFCESGEEYVPSIDKGVSWLAYAAINSTEPALRASLIDNVVLCGASSLFPGMRRRIQKELTHFYKEIHPAEGAIPISVSETPCREYGAWLGGCMLSQIDMFRHLTISRQEYEEMGHRIVHCKNL